MFRNVKINSKSEYYVNLDLIKDDFKKVIESGDPIEVGDNFTDLFSRLPVFVAFRIKALENGDTLDMV